MSFAGYYIKKFVAFALKTVALVWDRKWVVFS